MALLFSLREFGSAFATRERGAELREEIIARHTGVEDITIDFAEVTNVSYSFADEFVGKLASDRLQIRIDTVNMTERIRETVKSARERRSDVVAC